MLNKGLRDQESIRIDKILKTLLSLIFKPENLVAENIINVEFALKDFGLNIQSLVNFDADSLIIHLNKLHLDWNQKEQFADFLVAFSKENKYDFSKKAIAIYNHIQSESKSFSFEIFNKIALAQAN